MKVQAFFLTIVLGLITSTSAVLAAEGKYNPNPTSSSEFEKKVLALELREGDEEAPYPDQPLNLSVGLNIIFPYLNLEWMIFRHFGITVQPSLFKVSVAGFESSLYGSYLGVEGYSEYPFSGIWFQAAFGIFSSSAKYGTLTGTSNAYSTMTSLGYRKRWQSGWNVGAAAGLAYFDIKSSPEISYNPTYWSPIFLFSLGKVL